MSRLPERIADLVVRRPGAILLGTLVLTVAFAAQVPKLVSNPSPEDLIATYGSYDDARARFRRDFGTTDQIAVLIVSADDVLEAGVLSYVHALGRHLADEPGVSRVESLTTTPIPKPADLNDEELTLDSIEDQPEEDALPAEVLDALLDLVEAAPSRFPLGLTTISERRAELDVRPAVEGDAPTEDDIAHLRAALEDLPLVTGRLVSEDHRVTVIAVSLPADHAERRAAIAHIDAWLDEHPPPRGAELTRGGLPYVRARLVSNMQRDNRVLLPLTVLVCAVLLLVSFRSWEATILPLVTVGIATALLVGGMALFGEPMTIITNVIPPMMIIMGLEDSVHILDRFREELRQRKGAREESLRVTVRTIALACFLTSVTNAVGIAALIVAHTAELRRFAVIGSLGVMLAYVVTILFLPAALLKWKGIRPAPPAREEKLESTLAVLTAWIVRRPWRILIGTAIATAIAAFVSRSLVVDHALMDQFDRDDPIAESTRLLESSLEGVRPLEISLRADDAGELVDPTTIAAVDSVGRWARQQDAVLGTTSYTDVLHDAWSRIVGDPGARTERFRTADQTGALVSLLERSPHDPLERFLASRGRHGRVRIMVADVGAQATMRFVEKLERRLRPLRDAGIDVALTGEAFTGSVGTNAVIGDLFSSLSTAIAVIFVILSLLFRSLRLGLLSIPSNVLPLVGTTAWMVVRGIPLNLATAIIFSISMGLAVNGTIHVLARYREESARGLGRSVALVRAARGTGRGIVVACGSLIVGFGVLLFSSFVPVRHFGELIAVSAAFSLLATIFVQPALLKVGGVVR